MARAVLPAPDGGYGGFNTAVGLNALYFNNGSRNVAVGVQALQTNNADGNVAVGYQALFLNTTGFDNTANGFQALYSNTTGYNNTANGDTALADNTTGFENTVNGAFALHLNTTGAGNTANGAYALYNNTDGNSNTASGDGALLTNADGSSNTALGFLAGHSISGSGNVCIGEGVFGAAGENDTTRIRNIGTTAYNTGRYVQVDGFGKLGYVVSSRRYKHEIKPMDKASEALFALKPVTFRYNRDIDPAHVKMFGLIAEEVAEVAPDLVVRNEKGEPETLRFDSISAMLLNEFLKEHGKVQAQEATITQLKSTVARQQKHFQATAAYQQKQIEALTTSLQRVSDQLESSKPAQRTLVENR
jgi:uncharacterized coiled-coil protein SlyX